MAGLVFVIGLLVVGGLLFLGASLLLGRGETSPPADVERSPVELPEGRDVLGDDVRALRISVAFRGYRMTEVDWLLDQFAQVLDERDVQIATLRAQLPGPGGRHAGTLSDDERADDERDLHAQGADAVADRQQTDPEGVPVPAVDEQRRTGA